MNKKVVFLDVDGTLCNDLGLIPASAIEAIHKAKENGHKIYLCTGRCKAELYDFIMEIGFDGVIGSGGGFVESDGKMLYHKKFEEQDLQDILSYFNKYNMNYYIETNHGMFASKNCITQLNNIAKSIEEMGEDPNGCYQFSDALLPLMEDTKLVDVNKICFLDTGHPFVNIKNKFENRFTIMHCTVPMFGDNSGEVILKGVDKAIAMEYLLKHLGVDRQDTIAIGDGMNDAVMLQYAHIGIAMGNAAQGLKDIADDITSTHDEDGIYQSFLKHHLI